MLVNYIAALNPLCFYYTNHNPLVSDSAVVLLVSYSDVVPVISYSNADTQKIAINNDNRKKVGIYRWVNILTGKSYIGSYGDLSERFKKYFNINFLEKESTLYNMDNILLHPIG